MHVTARKYGSFSYRFFNHNFLKSIIHGRVRAFDNILTPMKRDPILRLAARGIIWHNMTYGIKARIKQSTRIKLKKLYSVSKYMCLVKFGEFFRTRRFYGYRLQKDKKKLKKLRKDMDKAVRQKLHQRRENSRLMRKAVMETRIANRNKAGQKAGKRIK